MGLGHGDVPFRDPWRFASGRYNPEAEQDNRLATEPKQVEELSIMQAYETAKAQSLQGPVRTRKAIPRFPGQEDWKVPRVYS